MANFGFLFIFEYSGFVVSGGFPLYKSDRPGGTCRETVSQPITIIIPQQLCLTADHADRALVARAGAQAAAIALFFVNFNDFAHHIGIPPCSFDCLMNTVYQMLHAPSVGTTTKRKTDTKKRPSHEGQPFHTGK